MEDEDNNDVVRFEKFMSVMTDVLLNKRFVFNLSFTIFVNDYFTKVV